MGTKGMIKTIDEADTVLADFANRIDLYEVRPGISKAIMYIGWYWRHISTGNVNIGKGNEEDFPIGFMQNNKWDYKERKLDKDEEKVLINLACDLDKAKNEKEQGYILRKLNEWMQSLTI
jgi:hypothetical protein